MQVPPAADEAAAARQYARLCRLLLPAAGDAHAHAQAAAGDSMHR